MNLPPLEPTSPAPAAPLQGAELQHDWVNTWFGYVHVQYKCRNCDVIDTLSYESGLSLDPVPPCQPQNPSQLEH